MITAFGRCGIQNHPQIHTESETNLGTPDLISFPRSHTNLDVGSGAMALRLKALDSLPEDPGSIPSTYVVTHTDL